MENIKFSEINTVVEFFRGSRRLGYGREGTCYKIGNMSYKFYNSLYRFIYSDVDSQLELLKLKDVVVDNFYFIRCLIYFNDKLMGSVSEYAKGNSCGKIWLHRRDLDKLIIALNTLKKNIYELSRYGICIEDHDLSNILYDGNVFSLIDVGDYRYSGDVIFMGQNVIVDDIDAIYRENMRRIVTLLFKGITNFDNRYDDFIFAYLTEINSPYKDYLEDIDLIINPDETISGIRDSIQEGIGREINAFSNCRNDLRRIRKMG